MALGRVDLDVAFLLRLPSMRVHLDELNTSPTKDGGRYWHVKMLEPQPGRYALQLPTSGATLALDECRLALPPDDRA